jgi:lysophospholipase L1-like esterase
VIRIPKEPPMPPLSRRSFLAAAVATPCLVRTPLPAALLPRELHWTDVAPWRLEGRAFAERKAPYDRLPAAAEGIVRKEVWELSRHSAGIAVRFATDAVEIHARYRLTSEKLAMPHMPATGVSGVDLYGKGADGRWRWAEVSRPTAREVTSKLVGGLPSGRREWLLYLPLYNGVEQLELGVAEGSRCEPLPPPAGKPIVVYGTSIAHGACASRPGMAWPALLGRALDREVVNLGFSGNGRMEAEVGRFLCELDPAVFVIDCLPNMSAAQVRERTGPLVRQLRAARAATPILLVEDRTFANAWLDPDRLRAHAERRQALRDSVQALRQEGVAGLELLAGEGLLGDDHDGTTDGSHPNDLGMTRQAAAVAAALRPLLRA